MAPAAAVAAAGVALIGDRRSVVWCAERGLRTASSRPHSKGGG
jgi:hypothetical protein